jgi:phenylacetate-CoA ligase
MEGEEVKYLPVSPLELLRERVISAIENVSFYRHLYAPFGPVPADERFLEWFKQLPIINKPQIQAAGPAALFNPQYNQSALIRKPTSGSTGIPFILLLDNTVSNFRKWRFQRPHQQVVKQLPTKLVFLFPWDFLVKSPREEMIRADHHAPGSTELTEESQGPKPNLKQESPPPSSSFTTLPKKTRSTKKTAPKDNEVEVEESVLNRPFTVNSWLPMEQIYEIVSELEPATLIGFASTIASLARWLLEENQRIPSIKQVWSTSEILSQEGGDAIRAAIGCEPLTIYASNEFGFMAWEARKGDPMCFDSDRLHVEYVKRDAPVLSEIGEVSRMVITDLLNDTMPLIRYDIEDIARSHEPVQVTKDLWCATITDLQGKQADILQLPDGRTVTPFQVLGAIRDHLPHAQYRFIEISTERYILQYRPGVGFSPENIDKVISVVKEILGSDCKILPQEVSSIEREPSGKLRPLINLCNVSETKRRELANRLGILPFLSFSSRDAAISIIQKTLGTVLPAYNSRSKLDESQELYADLAVDSLRFVNLIVELEKELGREINDEDLLDADLITIADLVKFVEGLIPV